jgi:hypothetical protein
MRMRTGDSQNKKNENRSQGMFGNHSCGSRFGGGSVERNSRRPPFWQQKSARGSSFRAVFDKTERFSMKLLSFLVFYDFYTILYLDKFWFSMKLLGFLVFMIFTLFYTWTNFVGRVTSSF